MMSNTLLDRKPPCATCAEGSTARAGYHRPLWRAVNLLSSKKKRRVEARGLLDGLLGAFRNERTHAPELVAIDMDSEGGLGGTSVEVFGPLAVMLIGYQPQEFERFRAFMIDMEADMVKMVCCNADLANRTLQQLLEAPTPDVKAPKLGARRAVIVSGMRGDEVSEVIGAYNDSGLPETVWAAAVPMNYGRRVSDLVHDIYGDHAYLCCAMGLARSELVDRRNPYCLSRLSFLDRYLSGNRMQRNNPNAVPR